MAVRRFGYRAEAFATFATSSCAARYAAAAALHAGMAAARPGLLRHALAKLLTVRPTHPVLAQAPIAERGIVLEEAWPERADDNALVLNAVYSLRVGVLDGLDAAVVSTMVATRADGMDVMWDQP